MGRIAAMFGSVTESFDGLARVFPTAKQLIQADLEHAGVPSACREIIHSLARQVLAGSLPLDSSADPDATIATLRSIAGIEGGAIEYMAMRALNEPDAFPVGHRSLFKVSDNCGELMQRARRWHPWRAYAAVLLWRHAEPAEKGRL